MWREFRAVCASRDSSLVAIDAIASAFLTTVACFVGAHIAPSTVPIWVAGVCLARVVVVIPIFAVAIDAQCVPIGVFLAFVPESIVMTIGRSLLDCEARI